MGRRAGASELLTAAAALALVGCGKQDDAFYSQIFTCTPSATASSCGTTRDGKPMTCFVGSTLGGEDFCTEACDPAQPPADSRFTCVSSGKTGALLKICRPLGSTIDRALGCAPPLECYRTNLMDDEGICLDMHVCTTNADCPGDTKRTLCASTILASMVPSLLAVDDLQCVQPTCTSGGALCPSGELCLADYFTTGNVPDICVPACDPYFHCPPNFSCAASASAPGSPAICVPGVPGTRCTSDQDCLIGTCFDTGVGFGECALTTTCMSAADCQVLSQPAFTFVCGQSAQTGERRCLSVNPFHGIDCSVDSDCTGDQKCYRYSPYLANQGHGECRLPCDKDLHCPNLAGVALTCLDGGAGGCYPGDFALECNRDEDCLADLKCLDAAPDLQHSPITSPKICTIRCASDADCADDPIARNNGFCMDGVCRLGGNVGDPCAGDNQCRSGRQCVFDASGQGKCTN